jgi:hypothetical protein
MGDKDRDRARRHPTRRNNLPNLVRNIHQLSSSLCRNLYRIHPLPFS